MEVATPEIKLALQERLLFLSRYKLVKGPPIHKSATCVVIKAYDERSNTLYAHVFKECANGSQTIDKEVLKTYLRKL
eukprot:7122165-Ditylum_brightwellii.AAC.1